MIPYWRRVRCTDEGCHIYECLWCKGQFESRTEPGYYDQYEISSTPNGGAKYECTVNGKKENFWSKEREIPIYVPKFHFCPMCGIKWKPVRCNIDNPYMYGPKRLRAYNLIKKRQYQHVEPRFWWVIEIGTTYSGEETEWTAQYKCNGEKVSAIQIYKHLQEERQICRQDVRIVIKHSLPNTYIYEVYR